MTAKERYYKQLLASRARYMAAKNKIMSKAEEKSEYHNKMIVMYDELLKTMESELYVNQTGKN